MMTSATFSTSMEAQQAAVLLEGYRFELGHHDARQWVSLWLESYRPGCIRDAVIEALYQGRYKSVSVRQILEMWQRRGQPIRHATHDFEAAVCREFGEIRLAPVPPEKLPERKQYRSIARSRQAQSSDSDEFRREQLSFQYSSQNGSQKRSQERSQNSVTEHDVTELRSGDRTIRRSKHASNTAVSFNLSALPPASPGMAARGEAVLSQHGPAAHTSDEPTDGGKPKVEIRDNRDWREFPSYITPAYSTSHSDEMLQAQRQFNGVLYSSARAIQPFKPALPFSAQTLRLAKQKAIALMNEAAQKAEARETRVAELQR